jgi:hypothetical protein
MSVRLTRSRGIAAPAVALALFAGGVLGGCGGQNGGGTTTAPVSRCSKARPLSGDARAQVVAVLNRYACAFSYRNATALGALLTPDVVRHGLRRGGCDDTRGRKAVLDVYRETFDITGSKSEYRLPGLSAASVRLAGSTASVNTRFTISSGGHGRITFELRKAAEGWLISRIKAAC